MTCCPTEKIWADFSSKPTQGLLFKQQRNIVMGLKEEDFPMHEAQHKRVITKYELQNDKEDNLDKI